MSVVRFPAAEYDALINACGLLDESRRGKLALTGAQAKEFLQGQVSNDVEALVAGTGCYAALLTPKGKMLGDARILDTGEELLLDTERVALQELFNMIRRFRIGYNVEVHKRTLERGLLSLIGPAAITLIDTPGLGTAEHSNAPVTVDGIAARVIRTAAGLDLLCLSEDALALSAALVARGAVEVGEEVAEIVRIEHGRPRFGIELDDTVIPQEAGLNERAVSFTKGCYVGQETVARLYYRGKPNRRLRGLRCATPVTPGEELVYEDRAVGLVGSAAVSPRLGPVALAFVRREAPEGATVAVGPSGVPAKVVELPFV